jgi:hypothetical protein
MSPLIPILALLAGALLVAIGTWLRFRYAPVVQVFAAALGGIALGLVGQALPQVVVLFAWRPISLFGAPVVLSADGYAWALGLAMLALVLAASLRRLAQPGELSLYPALMLAMSAAMLLVVQAANLLTLALTWGFLDVLYCTALLVREGQAANRRAELIIGLNGIATLSVWVAVIFLEQEGISPYWRLMTLSPAMRALLGLAAMLRLGLYPLYAWSSPEQDTTPQPVLLHLMPMVAGLTLWIRLASIQAIPVGDIWVGAALAGAILMGLLAWVQPDVRRSIPYVAIGYAGLMVVAGSGAGLSAASLTQGVVAWLLVMYVLAASPPFDIQHLTLNVRVLWGAPALIAMAALLGLPATAGAAYRMALHAGLSEMRLLWWGLAVLAETLLAGAALRRALAPQPPPAFERRLLLAAPVAGLVIATLPLVLLGVWPTAIFGSPAHALGASGASTLSLGARGWTGWLVPCLGMIALVIVSRLLIGGVSVQSVFDRWGKAASRVLDLSWLYDLALNSTRRAARLISSLAALMEGSAALIWMLLFIVLALLYLGGQGG